MQKNKVLSTGEKPPTAKLGERSTADAAISTGPEHFDTAFGRPRNFLNNRFAYTVISQRARGLSIGVNLNPDKRCNFDCLYCEVNRDEPARDHKVDIKVMAAESESLLIQACENKLGELAWFRNLPTELLQLKE